MNFDRFFYPALYFSAMSVLRPSAREHMLIRILLILAFIAVATPFIVPGRAVIFLNDSSFEGPEAPHAWNYAGSAERWTNISSDGSACAYIVSGSSSSNVVQPHLAEGDFGKSVILTFDHYHITNSTHSLANFGLSLYSNGAWENLWFGKIPIFEEIGDGWHEHTVAFNNSVYNGTEIRFLNTYSTDLVDHVQLHGYNWVPPSSGPDPAGLVNFTLEAGPYIEDEYTTAYVDFFGTPTSFSILVWNTGNGHVLLDDWLTEGPWPDTLTWLSNESGHMGVSWSAIVNGSSVSGMTGYDVTNLSFTPTPTMTALPIIGPLPTIGTIVPILVNESVINKTILQPYYDLVDDVYNGVNGTFARVEGALIFPISLLHTNGDLLLQILYGLSMVLQVMVSPIALINGAIVRAFPDEIIALFTLSIALGIVKQLIGGKNP